MNNPDPDILVRRFVDDDLSEAEVQKALHRIADDPEARNLLQFELRMTQDLASSPSAQPPSDFADRTMAALSEAPGADSSPSRSEEWAAWWRSITTPVALEVRPLSALVAAALLGLVAWTIWPTAPSGSRLSTETATTTQPATSASVQEASVSSTEQGQTVWIRFTYTNNEADSVAVAGDFSQWDPVPLSPRTVNGETVWTGLIPVSRGEHEYQFVINGERWVTDPLAPVKRSDGFGAENAVLEL
jgi:hypothetical protein